MLSGFCLETQCIIADTDLEFFASKKEYTQENRIACQYLYWNKNEVEKGKLTEMSIAVNCFSNFSSVRKCLRCHCKYKNHTSVVSIKTQSNFNKF